MSLEAVIFDFGDTLLRFDFDEDVWLDCLRVTLREADLPVDAAEAVRDDLRGRMAELYGDPDEHAELDWVQAVTEAMLRWGPPRSPEVVRAAIAAGDRGWAAARHLHPEAISLLKAVRERGLKIGILSNTPDPPDLWLDNLAADGVAEHVDAVVLSSQLGRRKPAPEIYRAALDALGVEPENALFVGDRVREDIRGPAALGMRTCLVTYFRVDEGDHALADAVAASPAEVLAVVDRVLAADGPGKL
jgi:HAD superfamily hydrolase (TIGR01509 family)